MRWVLPEYIQDVLPAEARKLEGLRRRLLDAYHLRGFQLVSPPLLEYLESLLTGAGRDLRLRTLKLVDQISGRTMGVRADMTPQVARIDAHLLNRQGVSRLCYCASVLHALPASLTASREPLQLGAEIYGHQGLEADIEVVRLLADSLAIAGVAASRIDIGHMGLFRALAAAASLTGDKEVQLYDMLQTKDVPALTDFLADVPEPQRAALLALPRLYGDRTVLERARAMLPAIPDVVRALDELERLAQAFTDLPVSFDLADLRGYHYHSGMVLAAYADGVPGAIALGGRYDRIGESFGRGRPATGFSLDLRLLARGVDEIAEAGAILAPSGELAGLKAAIDRLRARGEVVIASLPGHQGTWSEAGCDRQLVQRGGEWLVVPLQGEN
ncbi:MAG: ATP phosphoribosyltransferase regulatory subunit [Rhodocyclaceae bacterium]|nr:ATP phosphoribosyltransferase regulatory subunit [Rhodocyclaceae bacterium]MCP5232974.1 ATP phosphoribosyltransferase regulatory subunit [Zoogloeaceae bacterium]MCP5241242.1 ATP phosphoribosyltransferase regulatory subunit [Zoogloeaceae bacterium]MCP5255145.1 ATP phosphoribosyltransferase regulatory subunit [Zoogloeaceae bacterium]MCW5614670.1 ATP phosphoribosyltransferase regulatory subunit [Rhodocyclaceae bacterium]